MLPLFLSRPRRPSTWTLSPRLIGIEQRAIFGSYNAGLRRASGSEGRPKRMTQTIATLSKALDVIDELARAQEPVGISELSRRLGLTKNQVFRVLKTLEEYG